MKHLLYELLEESSSNSCNSYCKYLEEYLLLSVIQRFIYGFAWKYIHKSFRNSSEDFYRNSLQDCSLNSFRDFSYRNFLLQILSIFTEFIPSVLSSLDLSKDVLPKLYWFFFWISSAASPKIQSRAFSWFSLTVPPGFSRSSRRIFNSCS